MDNYPPAAQFLVSKMVSAAAARPDDAVAFQGAPGCNGHDAVLQLFPSASPLSVPGDVKIVGYDDLFFAQTSVPALTTIRQNIAAGASHLVESLLKRIAGEHAGSTVLNPELVVRSST